MTYRTLLMIESILILIPHVIFIIGFRSKFQYRWIARLLRLNSVGWVLAAFRSIWLLAQAQGRPVLSDTSERAQSIGLMGLVVIIAWLWLIAWMTYRKRFPQFIDE